VNFAEQTLPQLIVRSLPGVEVTFPELLFPTDKLYCERNVAETFIASFTNTEHVDWLPVQAPPHPPNTLPDPALAQRLKAAA